MSASINLEELRQKIEDVYGQFGYSMGWRLLYSPVEVIEGSRVAFLGLNPGGDRAEPRSDGLARKTGSAYVEEEWKGFGPGEAPLQRQVLALFSKLRVDPEQVLAGNIVPFRSPDWKSLQNKYNALQFGYGVWKMLLEAAKPAIVVAMGNDAHGPVLRLTGARLIQNLKVGWGDVGIKVADAEGVRVVMLPHLSRFRVIDRPESKAALAEAFGGLWPLA